MADITYYFNGDSSSLWTNPDNFNDGDIGTFANVQVSGSTHFFNGNTCPATDLGTITKVELRVHGYGDGDDRIDLTPVFAGGDGDVHQNTMPSVAGWSAYADITTDTNAPDPWTWAAVQNLDCDAVKITVGKGNVAYGSKVEIRVTYTPGPPTVTIQAVTDIAATTATGNGNITDVGAENCSKRGVIYNERISPTGNEGTTWSDPTNAYDDNEDSYATSGAANSTLVLTHAALTCGQIRYLAAKTVSEDIKIRVYKDDAWETVFEGGSGLGWQIVNFVAGSVTKAEISFTALANKYFYEFDFCETGSSEETDSFGTGAFERPMTGLTPETHYYVYAYAYNSYGYGYSDEVEFDTTEAPPAGKPRSHGYIIG